MCNLCTRDESVVSAPIVQQTMPVKTNVLERYKRKHNIVTDPMSEEMLKEVAYQPDLLAVSTQYTKLCFEAFRQGLEQLQETKAYVIATRTSQPFHVALALAVILTCLSRPEAVGGLRLWRALYVAAIATHLGAQIWMTLVSGIVLYFSLPRHEFGRVQTVLFPVYYTFNASVSLVGLLAYFRTQYLTSFERTSWVQLALLLAVFSIEAYVRLNLVHPMLRAKHTKTQMEEAAGGGQEIGCLVLGELAHCPRYMRVLKTFRTYHSLIAIGTMIALGCSFYSIMLLVDSMCT